MKILPLLQFLRILDQANQLSITNMSVMGALIAAIVTPNPLTVSTFAAALVSYQWKRYHDGRATEKLGQDDKARLDKLEAELSGLKSALALKR